MLKRKKTTGFGMKNGILLKNMTGVNSEMNPTRINMNKYNKRNKCGLEHAIMYYLCVVLIRKVAII